MDRGSVTTPHRTDQRDPPEVCDDDPVRHLRLAVIAAARSAALGLTVAVLTVAGPVLASSDSAATTAPPLTVPVASGAPTDTANDFVDLDRELSECVGNSNPKPGCGRAPTHSGDRGSPMQWAVFGVMTAGIAFIGWRIVAGARRTHPG